MPTETEIINARVAANAPATLEQIIKLEIDEWRSSTAYTMAKLGEEYYKGDQEILERKRFSIDKQGARVHDEHRTNKQLVHTFVRKLVDQKVGYLLSKEPSIQTENKQYAAALADVFDKAFLRLLKNEGKDAINGGRGWLHVYYNEAGELAFKRIPTLEGIPLWKDAAHTELDAFIRIYDQDYYEGMSKKVLTRVEYWDKTGVRRYLLNPPPGFGVSGTGLVPDVATGAVTTHFGVVDPDQKETGLNWERVPFVCFKYNDEEMPLIAFLKSLVDDYDEQRSDNANNLTDLPDGIYVLKEYDGADLGEFRRNLSRFRAVKVSGEGGVDTLTLDLNPEALRQHIEQLRKDIYEFGRGVDTQSDKIGSSPSGIALRFLFSDLDMDANTIETEFQAALEQLLWFVDQHLANTGAGDFTAEAVDFIFNRDILINETEAVTNAKASVGVISDETVIANHPWVTDPQEELKRLDKQKQQALKDAQEYGGLNKDDPPGGGDE